MSILQDADATANACERTSVSSQPLIVPQLEVVDTKDLDHLLVEINPRLVFVDFDHTLFACNSTELFIAFSRPSLLVAILDFLVRQCIPWQRLRLPSRLGDYLCCIAIIALLPWNLHRWTKAAPSLFARYESPQIKGALRRLERTQLVIISFGLTFIVRRLIKGSSWEDVHLIATPLVANPAHFRSGKLQIASRHHTAIEIASAAFISDSLEDHDLLDAVGQPILIRPQGPLYRAPEHLYLPLRYTAGAKYPATYVLDQVLLVDILLIALAISRDVHALMRSVLIVPILFLSVMCIYEIGYFENDMLAARREPSPTLTDDADRFRSYPILPSAWIWSLAFGVGGIEIAYSLDALGPDRLIVVALAWITSLLVLRATFFLYNHTAPFHRVTLYPILQLLKYLPIFIIFSPAVPGIIAVFSQIAMTTALYLTYRQGGQTKTVRREPVRTVLFAAGLAMLAAAGGLESIETQFCAATLLLWSGARLAKAPILAAIR